jgi:hypothetical protein
MYNHQDAAGIASSLYFTGLIVVGSFFLLNLFLAVIMETFSEMTEIQAKIEQAKKHAKMRTQRMIQAQ